MAIRLQHICDEMDDGVELSVRFDLNEDEKAGHHLFRSFLPSSLSLSLPSQWRNFLAKREREKDNRLPILIEHDDHQ